MIAVNAEYTYHIQMNTYLFFKKKKGPPSNPGARLKGSTCWRQPQSPGQTSNQSFIFFFFFFFLFQLLHYRSSSIELNYVKVTRKKALTPHFFLLFHLTQASTYLKLFVQILQFQYQLYLRNSILFKLVMKLLEKILKQSWNFTRKKSV